MRPTREEALVATAFVWAKRSTCSRLAVGAVIHRDGRILTQGYNGAPAGMTHCDHRCTCGAEDSRTPTAHASLCHAGPNFCRAVHAEQNAIAYAARYGVRLEDAEIVVTHQPCLSCARLVINAGIRHVTYVNPYRDLSGLHLLLEAGIPVDGNVDWDEPRLIGLLSDETS